MAVPAVVNMPFIKLPQGSRLPGDFGLIRGPPAFPNPATGGHLVYSGSRDSHQPTFCGVDHHGSRPTGRDVMGHGIQLALLSAGSETFSLLGHITQTLVVALRFPPQASCIYGRPNHGNRLPQPRRHCRDWLSRTPWRCRCFSTSRLGLGTPTHGLSETAFPHGKHESTWPRRRSINIRQAAALSRRGPVYYPDPSPIRNLASPAASRLPQICFIVVGKGKARRLAPPPR